MNGNKPTVFLSSTIYDFRDLRSALKFWFEEFGYEVAASDWNDFRQDPRKNSYESCLRAIDSADYFVLLIGGRVGGWYDEANRVSITRMEYRHAYERAMGGHLRLLTFVRKEIWDIREDRAALKKLLAEKHALDVELSEADRKKIVEHPSRFVNDAEFIFDFVKEVGRVSEMKQAAGGGELPVGNWIYQFSTFREVADACKSTMRMTGSLRHRALAVSLAHDLHENLRRLCDKKEGQIGPVASLLAGKARQCFRGDVSADSTYLGADLLSMAEFVARIGVISGELLTSTLREAIHSGEFLEFDAASGTHVVGPFHKALLELERHIERFRLLAANERVLALLQPFLDPMLVARRNQQVTLPNSQVGPAFVAHDLAVNMAALTRGLLVALEGDREGLAGINLLPFSPYLQYMDLEEMTDDELRAWCRSPTTL